MRLKNDDPYLGLRQIVTGRLLLPRYYIVDLIRRKRLTSAQLGDWIMYLITADWDLTPNRLGKIRISQTDMGKVWLRDHTTFSKLNKLFLNFDMLGINGNIPYIKDYKEYFTKASIDKYKKIPDEIIHKMFEGFQPNVESIQTLQAENRTYFRVSNKDDIYTFPKKVVIKQEPRSDEEYRRIKETGGDNYPEIDDMKWIDEHVSETQEIKNDTMEQEVINIFFNGDRQCYENNLIIS